MKHLQEFCPKNGGLLGLNVNRGAAIKIRLRQPHDSNSFYPYEEHILGTMVHELTHMVEGSHSSRFYKLMDELHDEVDRDISAMRSYPSASFIPFNKGIYRAIHHFHHTILLHLNSLCTLYVLQEQNYEKAIIILLLLLPLYQRHFHYQPLLLVNVNLWQKQRFKGTIQTSIHAN